MKPAKPTSISRDASHAFDALQRRAELAERRLAEAEARAREAEKRAAAAEASAAEQRFGLGARLHRIEKAMAGLIGGNSHKQSRPILRGEVASPAVDLAARSGATRTANMTNDNMQSLSAVAGHLGGVSVDAVRWYAKAHGLPLRRVGRAVFASRAELDRWLAARGGLAESEGGKP